MSIEQLKLQDIRDVENILGSMENMDKETLKNTLAYLLKVYVIDRELAYEGTVIDSRNITRSVEPPADFTELMTELKRNYTMEELKKFSIEGGKVFLTIDNKRYQISSSEETSPTPPPVVPPVRQEPVQTNRPLKPQDTSNRFRNLEMDD